MTARQRGQPLIFLAMVVVLWVGARMTIRSDAAPEADLVVSAEAAPPGPQRPSPADGLLAAVTVERGTLSPARPAVPGQPRRSTAAARYVAAPSGAMTLTERQPLPVTLSASAGSVGTAAPPTTMVVSNSSGLPQSNGERRWSGDAWVLVRSGGGTIGAGPGAGIYGGNQVGGVLRYRLALGNANRPTAYLRVTSALNGSGEREAALGLSVRPVAAVPVYVAAEGRVGTFSGRTLVRPAVMAVTEFPPARLPGKARAEFYAQAGYVGGTNATPFADGQVKVDRRVIQAGPVEVRAGAGAWGGAQRGAARFDLGPSATLGISRGAAAARLALDWRFRLAGDARPASGPALTVSAGF